MAKHTLDLEKLCPALKTARWVLERPRANRKDMVRQYVGKHYSDTGSNKTVPLNLIAMYCAIVGRALIPKNPRFLYSTFDREHKAACAATQEWMNIRVQEMRLDKTLQRVVFDALFSVGILKVGLATPADAGMAGWNLQAGQPFAERIDLDDIVFDVHCRDFREASFFGHRFRAPLEMIKESKFYNKARKKLTASYDSPYNQEGDERISHIGRGDRSNWEEFEDMVDLWEIYLPREKKILTLASDDGGTPVMEDEPIGEWDWVGPDTGPIKILGYMPVPGNPMPKGPIQDLYDLHMLVNRLYRKLMAQSERQKEILGVMQGADPDGKRIVEASDGDAIRLDQPDKAKLFAFGGPNQANTLFMEQAWQLFSKHGGNLEMAGGLAPQSKTATQDKMLNQNSSGQLASMQQDTIDFIEEVGQAMGWFYWHHPTLQMKSEWHPKGLPEYGITSTVHPAGAMRRDDRPQPLQRNASWSSLQIKVDAFSLQQQTPQSKMQAIQGFLQMMQPYMQQAQQQGVGMNLNTLVTMFAKFQDLPEILEVLTVQEMPAEGQSQPSPGQPAETTRNYVRRSLGGESEQATTADRMAELAKGNGQNNSMPLNPNGMAG